MRRGGSSGGALPYSPHDRVPGSSRRLYIKTEYDEFIPAETPTIDDLMKHAQRFGTNQVVETAIALGYQYEAVVRLQRQLDVIAREEYAKEHSGRTGGYVAPKKSIEDRVKKLMGITDEEDESATTA